MASEADGGSFDLELRLRPHARFASAVRVLCSSVAAEQGFDVVALGDLRVAIEDGFMSILGRMAPISRAGTDDIVIVRIIAGPDRLDVEYSAEPVLPPVESAPVHRTIGTANDLIVTHGERITLARVADVVCVDHPI